MNEITEDMQYKLERIVSRYRKSIEDKYDKENPWTPSLDFDNKRANHFRGYISTANEFFHQQGCETTTSYYILKNYYPRKGSWKFKTRRPSGLIWINYDEDRWRSPSLERYWVGIPKKIALQIIETDKFPVGGIMTKCEYCDYEYESTDEFVKHLNDKHFRCAFCSRVFNCKEGKTGAVCDKCLEKHNK